MSFIDNIRKSINSDYIIGAFHKKGAECYFDDLRRPSGARIKGFKGVTIEAKAKTSVTNLVEDEFYEFSYELECLSENEQICQFISVGNVRPVDKNKLLKVRLDEKMQLQGTNLDDANQNQAMINQEVTGAPHTYIYELLQNSNDYPCLDINEVEIPVEVKFIVTENYLFFIHSGAPFSLRNIAAICTVNEGEKRNNTKTIGYKGMGFKSVFVNNDYVYLNSGGWSLRFDEKEINKPGAEERNWQYMPIATEEAELDSEVLNVLRNIPIEMNVFFALRHQRDAKENIPNLETVFKDDRILVFIPYVDHVEVFVGNELRFDRYKDRQHWLIKDDLKIEVDENYKKILEKSLKTDKKIPEKFQQIKEISLSFAVQREGNRLQPVSNSQVYNYLPTEQPLYVPFLINADFVPDASRKSLPDHEWNLTVLEDAGHKYAQWWASLILDKENYDLSSIFDLLPDFREGDKYRASFMKGFEDEIGKIKCIPIERDGNRVLVSLSEIIYDFMGFVVADNPVMSDSDFYTLLGVGNLSEYLPHPEIRRHQNLKMLLDHYSAKNIIGRFFNKYDLLTILQSSKFNDWVKNESNAINLYRYLFESGKIFFALESCPKIFLSESGVIESPNQLYLNINSYLEELYMFEDRLPRLKKSIREALPDKFRSIEGKFKRFVAPTVALELAANFDRNEDASRIENIKDSIHFLNFLATAKEGAMTYNGGMPKTMPLYLNEGISIGKENVYQEDDLGRLLSEQPWVKPEWIHFIHYGYVNHSEDLTRFLNRCGITTISPAMIWNSFIADDERSKHIISIIGEKQTNIDFFYFLTNIEKEVRFTDPTKQLKNQYHIWVNDGTSEEYVPLSYVIYWPDSKERNELLEKDWLPAKSCFAIDDDYLGQFLGEDRNAIERILKSNSIVEDFSVSSWIKRCMVKEHLWPDIIKNITSTEASISLLNFFFENRACSSEIGYGKFKQIPLSLEGETEMLPLNDIAETVYQRSEDLVDLSEEPWFPSYELTSVSSSYSKLFDGADRRAFFDEIGIKEFDLDDYIEETILENLGDYTDYSDSDNPLQANISFHKFFANPLLRLSDNDYEKLKNTPVFTILPNEEDGETKSGLCEVCTGFFLPSDKLGKLVELDIAPTSVLHTIRPEYFAIDAEQMTTYFKDKLGNRQLQDNELVKHLLIHKEDIISYIQDYKRNLRFWQWAAQSSTTYDERLAFRSFPMLDSDGNLMPPNELYASAVYSKDKEAEHVIRRFIPDAHFVLDDYAKIETEDEIDWLRLFKNIKISVSAEYVLINKVLPKLEDYKTEDEDVVLALAGVLEALKAEHNSDSKRIEGYIQNLYVKCNDGQYRKIGGCILTGAYMGVESGKYSDIELTSQISEDYLKEAEENPILRSNVISFFRFLIDKTKVDVIKSAQDLAARKVERFLANQQYYAKSDAHFRIIGELAEDCYQRVGWTDTVFRDRSVLLYSSDNRLISMDKGILYLGSVYNPLCDYQANGMNSIHYVSDEYRKYAELASIRSFLINPSRGRVKWGFHGEAEMRYLEDSTFSTYFWSVFLPSQLKNKDSRSHFDRLLTTDTMEKYRCIPTGGGMKKPSQVYNPIDSQLVRMIKVMEKQDEYLPTVEIPIEYSYGFASRLNEMDCLEFLRKSENDQGYQDDRIKVCTWLSELPENILRSNFKNIALRFKENALWRNGAKKWVPLKDLCILERTKESKLIVDHFGGSEYVCFGASLPESNQILQKLHLLFGIPLLNKDDFDHKSIGNVFEDTCEVSEIQKRLVYLSYTENPDGDWETKYKERQAKLDNAKIEGCDEIIYFYSGNEDLSTTLSFLDNGDNGFAYKKGRKDQMFESRLNWAIKTFDLVGSHISVLQELFLDDFSDYVEKHNGGSLPPNVLYYLPEYEKSKIGTDVVEETPDDTQQPYISGASVPESHDTTPSQTEEQPINHNGIPSKKPADQESRPDPSKSYVENGVNEGSGEHSIKPETTQSQPKEKTREELPSKGQEGYAKPIDNSAHPNDTSEVSNETPDIPDIPEESFEERSRKRWEQRRDAKVTPPTSAQPTHKGDEEVLDIEDKTEDTPNYGDVYDPNSRASIKRTPKSNTSLPKSSAGKELDNARRKAKEEEEKQDRRNKLYDLTPYTLEWFNYLIDMQLEAVYENKSVERHIDLYDWAQIDKESNLYRLVSPSSYIPSNLSEASNARILIVDNGKKQVLNAEILESDESGIDMKCTQYFGSPSATRWIRIEYQNIGGFSHAQANRFSQLNRDWNLGTNLVQKLPPNLEFIYGPPGTGKTTELVKRISEALRVNPRYNILVVTPTNRAADEIAERLVNDVFVGDYISRYGVTESRDLVRNHTHVLKNRQTMDLKKSNKNVMVTTIARYPYDSVQPGDAIFDLKWDLIIVDEASMIDIVPITLLLVNNRADKFIIAGDPKQIRPVKPNFDYPDEYVFNIYDMVGLNSFKEAAEGNFNYPVMALDVQHRSVPSIGNLVSKFSYDGILKNDPYKAKPKKLEITGIKVEPINVIGYEVIPMSHLYDFNIVDNSAVHVYSAIFAYEFAAHIANIASAYSGNEHYTIGIVSPYKKQASAIQEMLASRKIDTDKCSVNCGTVHKFQGGECDIMIVVMNYPNTYSGQSANINNLNIMNVAMSRAKDYVFFLSPEKRIGEKAIYPMNDELFRQLPNGFNFYHAHAIEKIMFDDETYIAKNASLKSHLPVNVSTPSGKHYEVRISDTALDIQIND